MTSTGPDTSDPAEADDRPTERMTGSAPAGPSEADDRPTERGTGPEPSPPETVLYMMKAVEPGPVQAPRPRLDSPLEERYILGEKLGSGGFGVVHRGFDRRLGRAVAIKMSKEGLAPIGEVDPFLQEARKAAQLQHPGIVTIHDVGLVNGRCWIVTELLDGVGLDAWLRSNRPGWATSAELVALLADALAHAHSRGVIHRDLKPSNVVLVDGKRPVLLDLGLAMAEDGGRRDRGLILGTLSYMSPEQARGEAHQPDGRMDVYSLGVTLYEMLCGRRPFRASGTADLLWQVQESTPQPPRQVRPEIPPDLERACLKAMSKRAEDRHATASDLADDLRRCLASAPAPVAAATVAPVPEPRAPARPATPSAPSRPERRQVTVLHCVFEAGDDDDEDAHDRFLALRESCREAASRSGGLALPAQGLAFSACFGYPVSQEQAPRLAVETGLEILRDPAAGSPRIAIATGSSIITEAEGSSPEIHGEVMTGLARLVAVAGAGEVTVGSATRRLIRGFFQVEPIEGAEAHRVVAKLDARNRVEAAEPGRLTPLIGRSREVDLLTERWEQAADERMGHVVLLVGDPGLGKSRLLHVLKEHVRAGQGGEGPRVVEWYCSPHHQNSPLYPAIDHLARAFGLLGGVPEGRLDLLAARLADSGMAGPEHLALFASLLSIPLDGRVPALELTPDRRKERMLSALLGWLRSLGGGAPVLFIVEDLHWVDPTTQELLGVFVEQGGEDGTLAVFTARPEYHPPWHGRDGQTQVALTRLTRRQVSEMMRAKIGDERISPSLIDQIVERTDGVPLFVEEFGQMLAESGADLGGTGSGDSASRVRDIAIPATLQDLLVARLDRMSSRKEVVELGAVIGRTFDYEMIEAVAGLDPATLRVELAKLVNVGMLFAKGEPPTSSYTFKHALIQDAAYQLLTKKPRQEYHRKIAETLVSRFPEVRETRPELVAHHFTEAGDARRGIDHWLLAGLRSRDRSAHVEALGHLSKGHGMVRALTPTPDRDALELSFRLPLGASSIAVHGYASPEVDEHNRAARELCEALGGDAPLFDVMMVIWSARLVQGRIAEGIGMVDELLALAEVTDDDGLRAEACWAAGCNAHWEGDFAQASRHLERGLACFRVEPSVEHARFTNQNSGLLSTAYAALDSWHLGDLDRARHHVAAVVELSERLRHPFSTAGASWHVGHLHELEGDAEVALAWADRLIALCEEHAFPFYLAIATGLKGAALLGLGEPEKAIPLIRQSLGIMERTGCEKVHQHHLGCLAEAHWEVGQLDEARQALDRAFAINDRDIERADEAELYRRRGMLRRIEDPADFAGAEAAWLRSIEVARRQGARFFELRTAALLAEAWHDQGRTAEALGLLRPLLASFPEGSDARDVVHARGLLGRLGP